MDQQKQVQEYCDKIGAELVDTISCQVSGAKMNLNQGMLKKAIELAQSHGADLAVSRLDRASRSASSIMLLKEMSDSSGIDIHIASLGKSMKNISALEAGMMGLVADAERRSIRERIQRACRDRVGAFSKDVCPKQASSKGLKVRMERTKQWAEAVGLKNEIINAAKMLKVPNQRNVVQVLNGRNVLSRTGRPWSQPTFTSQLKVLGWNWDELKSA